MLGIHKNNTNTPHILEDSNGHRYGDTPMLFSLNFSIPIKGKG